MDLKRKPVATGAAADWTELLYQQSYCAGRWLGSTLSAPIDVQNPSTGDAIGSVPSLGVEEARNAIAAAQATQPTWERLLPRERSDVLMRWYGLVMDHRQQLSVLLTKEQGKPLNDSHQ